MSTYTDLHNQVKENITVDYNNRITTQRVRFLNEQNEFWGTLRGNVSAENITIEGGVLKGVTLEDTILNGSLALPDGIDLHKVLQHVKEISSNLTETTERLDNEVEKREKAIRDEATLRSESDIKINSSISLQDFKLNTEILSVRKDLSTEILSVRTDYRNDIDKINVDIYNQSKEISTTLSTVLGNAIKLENTTRENNDAYLSNNIDVLKQETSYLSDEIDETRASLIGEVANRQHITSKLELSIANEVANSKNRDNILSNELLKHANLNCKQFADLSNELFTKIEHDRHYVINNGSTTASNTDNWPYSCKDFAVNIYNPTINDGIAYYQDASGEKYNVGQIFKTSSDELYPFTLKTLTEIQHCGVESALIENWPYGFDINKKSQRTEMNGYTISFDDTKTTGQLSDFVFNIIPTLPQFHKMEYFGTMIGKVSEAYPVDYYEDLISGKIWIDTNDSELETFNKFRNVIFDKKDLSVINKETERITYLGNNKFKLQKNINRTPFIGIRDRLNLEHTEFGRIFENRDGIKGIVKDTSKITEINVYMDDPYNKMVRLYDTYNFRNIVKENIPFGDGFYDIVLSANVVNETASFDLINVSELYKYNFNKINVDGVEVVGGYIVPKKYNKTIAESIDFNSVDVNIEGIMWINAFKGIYTLTKVPNESLWTFEDIDDDKNILNIMFNGTTLYVKVTSGNDGAITKQRYQIKVNEPIIFNPTTCHTHVYTSDVIDLSRYTEVEDAPGATYEITVNANVTTEEFPKYTLKIANNDTDTLKIQIPERTSTDISREFTIVINPDCFVNKLVKLELVDSEGNAVKIVNNRNLDILIPTNMWTTFQVNEINNNVFFVKDFDDNEDHHYIRVLSNAINIETNARIINDNSISNIVDKLSTDLSTDIDNLSTSLSTTTKLSVEELQDQIIANDNDIEFLSNVADYIISVDTEHVSYKKTLPYLANLSNAITHEDLGYNYLSTFILQNIGINTPNKVRLGDLFKLSAIQSCLYDASIPPKSIQLGENDFFVVNKDIMVSAITIDDIDIFRNAEREFNWLSTALSTDIDNLSTSLSNTVKLSVENIQDQLNEKTQNIIDIHNAIDKLSTDLSTDIDNLSTSLSTTTKLSVEELQDQIIANDNDIEYLSGQHDQLSTALSTDIDNLSTSLSTTTKLSVENIQTQLTSNDADIEFLSDDLSTLKYHHYEKTLSNDIILTHDFVDNNGNIVTKTSEVDQLIIVDEITFDKYRLTIRNGSLHINLVEKYEIK